MDETYPELSPIEWSLPVLRQEIGHTLGMDRTYSQRYLMNAEVYPNRLQKISHC
jgi:hypothetical protein